MQLKDADLIKVGIIAHEVFDVSLDVEIREVENTEPYLIERPGDDHPGDLTFEMTSDIIKDFVEWHGPDWPVDIALGYSKTCNVLVVCEIPRLSG